MKRMNADFDLVKSWIFVTACSFFVYVSYWFGRSVWATTTYQLDLLHVIASVGLIARFVGAFYTVFLAFSFLKAKSSLPSSFRGNVCKALLCEGIYYLSFLPGVYCFLISESYPYPFIEASYLIQILLVSPLFVVLGLKVQAQASSLDKLSRLVGAAALCCLIAMWIINEFKWLEALIPLSSALAPLVVIGFSNTTFTSLLSIAFAFAGILPILRKSGSINLRMCGLSLTLLGLQSLIFMLYSVAVGALKFVLLSEIWPIPTIGLGISLLMKGVSKASTAA